VGGDTRYIGDDYYPNDKHLVAIVYCVSILNGYIHAQVQFCKNG
jgi:hypothetical protein